MWFMTARCRWACQCKDACPVSQVLTVRKRAAVQKQKQQELEGLPDSYYQTDVNTVLQELQQLPVDFTVQHLDDIVEARASVLEVDHLSSLFSQKCQARLRQY